MSALMPLELVILEGEQAGAKIALESEIPMSIGVDIDNDVVIRDMLATTEKIAICQHDEGTELKILAGEVEISGQRFAEGQTLNVPMYTPIRIGKTLVAYGESESFEWHALNRHRADGEGEAATASIAQLPAMLWSGFRGQSRVNQNRLAGFAMLSVLLVFSSVIMAHRYKNPGIEVDPMAQLTALKALLNAEGYDNLEPKFGENGRFYITGYLADQNEHGKLEELLTQTQMPATVDVAVGEDLAAAVYDIYRVKGIVVATESAEPGVVKVKASELNVESLEQTKQIALRDVDGLKSIELENTLPSDSDKDNGIDGIVFSSPNKRIVLIVEGDPSYFVTSDRSRYYVGSRLPSGYVIEEINDNNVLVTRSGISTRLKI